MITKLLGDGKDIATVHTSAKDVQTDFHVTCVWVYAISQ